MRGGCACGDKECFDRGITNGNQWYRVDGGMQDWNYNFLGTFEVTVEVSCDKFPPAAHLPAYWRDNHAAMLSFVSQVHSSAVSGFVKTVDGLPVAKPVISVSGIEKNVTGTENGEYWRLLAPGTYELTFSAENFVPKTKEVTLVNASSSSSPVVNVTLLRPSDQSAEKSAQERMMHLAHESVDDNARVRAETLEDVTEGKARKHANLSNDAWVRREDFGIVENNLDTPDR
jgi:carboxypeptidase D